MSKLMYLHPLDRTLHFAFDCPFCHRLGGLMSHQEIKLNANECLTILNSFACIYCFKNWDEAIDIEVARQSSTKSKGFGSL
jgi:hypothetical protein